MCGRYLLREKPDWATHSQWKDYWADIQPFTARFNIAPSQRATVVYWDAQSPRVASMQWGFRPSWSKASFSKINARSETVFESKMFATSAHTKRCLIPADGFYEPKGSATQRNRPWHLFEHHDKAAFMMAGLWTTFEEPSVEDEPFENSQSGSLSFCILTTAANQLVSPIHHRMPIIVPQAFWEQWLSDSSKDSMLPLLSSREYSGMHHFRVAETVKNVSQDIADCAEPVDELQPGDNLSLF